MRKLASKLAIVSSAGALMLAAPGAALANGNNGGGNNGGGGQERCTQTASAGDIGVAVNAVQVCDNQTKVDVDVLSN